VYTALDRNGPQRYVMRDIYRGEQLALAWPNDFVRGRLITLQPLQDGDPSGWTPAVAAAAATDATQSSSPIAYIGDFDSAATATSLPITNGDDLLQVSPASPYIGLTDASVYDVKGEPGSYYPAGGTQTFARLGPTDSQEATATVAFMRAIGVRRLFAITDTAPYASYDSVIATMVANDARHAGVQLVGSAQVNSATTPANGGYAPLARSIAAARADGVIVGAAPDAGIEALWRELYGALGAVKLFAPSTLATNPFLSAIGQAENVTYVTSPILPLSWYRGYRVRQVLRAYRQHWKQASPTPWVLYGYEAMRSVLAAIRWARNPDNRLDVVRAYFHPGWREKSAIGPYWIDSHGDTSRSRFVGYGVYDPGKGPKLIPLADYLSGG